MSSLCSRPISEDSAISRVDDECHEVAEVLLVGEYVHHEREHGEEQILRELESEEDLEVAPDLELEVSHPHLDEDSGHREERHERDEHERETKELAEKERPAPVPATRP